MKHGGDRDRLTSLVDKNRISRRAACTGPRTIGGERLPPTSASAAEPAALIAPPAPACRVPSGLNITRRRVYRIAGAVPLATTGNSAAGSTRITPVGSTQYTREGVALSLADVVFVPFDEDADVSQHAHSSVLPRSQCLEYLRQHGGWGLRKWHFSRARNDACGQSYDFGWVL
ncbi:hypothetical protein PMIN01_13626 [Paraphaeosphaeria minitans]|uniref:Uncharacterized protein n=1 Tax=Paraphaeosphaeria minitans TaxID=565426 RepID=A0A9P6G5R4_9PLEO|nr:hypothetical protein PMIN01_13626 [Paraphaeosphaeria minitans]